MKWWHELKRRWKEMLVEYGQIALGTWLAVFAVTLAGFVIAIEAGFQPEGVAMESGKWGMAYAATQLTKPIRIWVVLAATPVVARFLRRGKTADDDGAEDPGQGVAEERDAASTREG
jgi:hypothetical protein